MPMGKSDLDKCVDQLYDARERLAMREGLDCDEKTGHLLIKAIGLLANYCRKRGADHPALTPVQLHSTIENLLARIEALESTAEALHARAEPAPNPYEPAVFDQIRDDCRRHGWNDCDAEITWAMGRVAMLQVRGYTGRFPHD